MCHFTYIWSYKAQSRSICAWLLPFALLLTFPITRWFTASVQVLFFGGEGGRDLTLSLFLDCVLSDSDHFRRLRIPLSTMDPARMKLTSSLTFFRAFLSHSTSFSVILMAESGCHSTHSLLNELIGAQILAGLGVPESKPDIQQHENGSCVGQRRETLLCKRIYTASPLPHIGLASRHPSKQSHYYSTPVQHAHPRSNRRCRPHVSTGLILKFMRLISWIRWDTRVRIYLT